MTQNKTYIQSYCNIQNNEIDLNGEIIFKSQQDGFSNFSKQAYQNLEINYPKFFKMDNLSKLAFLAADLLLKKVINTSNENNIALVFANASSSIDTDIKYQNSISDEANYFPSPAVFVYTLPNICIGEISIRHQLKSENSFFIFAEFNSTFMVKYANFLLENKKADKVLCGWVEFYNEKYKGFIYLVGDKGDLIHNEATLKKIYHI
jgi:hypothetical protein